MGLIHIVAYISGTASSLARVKSVRAKEEFARPTSIFSPISLDEKKTGPRSYWPYFNPNSDICQPNCFLGFI